MREQWWNKMKNKELKIRISERRLNKVRLYAVHADKTMTQVIEELIDSLPTIEIDKKSAIPTPSSTDG
jgi:hypothetical protein